MTEFSIGGFVFWLVFLCGIVYLYLKIKKKEITFLKVLGLGFLCYLSLFLIAFVLFIMGDLF